MAKVVGFDDSAKKRVTCRGCAAIVEYTQAETHSYVHYDYGGGRDTVYFIKCPNCGNDITVRFA